MQEASVCESVESLNALDLDIEALEQRLDMLSAATALGYVCVGDTSVVTTVTACQQNNPHK